MVTGSHTDGDSVTLGIVSLFPRLLDSCSPPVPLRGQRRLTKPTLWSGLSLMTRSPVQFSTRPNGRYDHTSGACFRGIFSYRSAFRQPKLLLYWPVCVRTCTSLCSSLHTRTAAGCTCTNWGQSTIHVTVTVTLSLLVSVWGGGGGG